MYIWFWASECTLGSYCYGFGEDAVCKAYAAKNASCSDAKCRPGLICSNDKCVVQYSLENGAESNNYDACKSGHSYYTGTGNEKKCGVVKTAPTCEAGDTTKDATITFASDVVFFSVQPVSGPQNFYSSYYFTFF